MRIGILGGTFDPPHLGHLGLARGALATGEVERVLLIPARTPPHKERPDMNPPQVRLAMARLLAGEDARLEVSDIELGLPEPSYTIDTVRHLCGQRPGDSFRLIIGADMAEIFGIWREAEELLRLAPPLVARRPGFALLEGFGETCPEELSPAGRRILRAGLFAMPEADVSSSTIREACAAGRIPQGVLTGAVAGFIRENRLYVC